MTDGSGMADNLLSDQLFMAFWPWPHSATRGLVRLASPQRPLAAACRFRQDWLLRSFMGAQMKLRTIISAFIVSLVAFVPFESASANTVVDYTITGGFLDGSTITSGSFSMDYTSPVVSAFDVTLSSGDHFTVGSLQSFDSNSFSISSVSQNNLYLFFGLSILDADYHVGPFSAFIWQCTDAICEAHSSPLSISVGLAFSNVIPDSATPLPAALPLFASGLGALGLLGWRRKNKAAARAA